VNQIVNNENLQRDNNIYVFYGTDGDDWEEEGTNAIESLKAMTYYAIRIGITIARNTWAADLPTTVEKYIENSNLLKEKSNILRMDNMVAEDGTEDRLIEGIKKLIS